MARSPPGEPHAGFLRPVPLRWRSEGTFVARNCLDRRLTRDPECSLTAAADAIDIAAYHRLTSTIQNFLRFPDPYGSVQILVE